VVTAATDPLAGVSPFPGFLSAAQGAVEFLHERIGLDLWLVTEVQDNRQVAVVAHPNQMVLPGMSLPWAEGFCSRMVAGQGPRVASVTAAVPAYAGLALGPAQRVAAYLGVPLLRSDGTLYGTLCGFALRAQPVTLGRHLPLVEHMARMLGTVLAQEEVAAQREELIAQAIADSERDVLTGLLNRRGWERAVEQEEARCRRTGSGAIVVVLDLDGLKSVNDTEGHAAGDAYLRCVADVLTENSRPTDVVARIGGDEFAVLAGRAGPAPSGSEASDFALVERLERRLAATGCSASVGMSGRRGARDINWADDNRGADGNNGAGDSNGAGNGIAAAWSVADAAMYAVKIRRRAERGRD
jgi:diguanylate cyclase